MNGLRTCLGLLLIAALAPILGWLLLGAFPSQPLQLGTNRYYGGYIEQGAAFGVHVGDSRAQARKILGDSGVEFESEVGCISTIRAAIGCTPEQRFDLYFFKERFRHGRIYVEISGERVSSIAWDAQLLAVIDL